MTRVNLNTVVKCSHVVSASSLYAGEYLGVLQMIENELTISHDSYQRVIPVLTLNDQTEKKLYHKITKALCNVKVVEWIKNNDFLSIV